MKRPIHEQPLNLRKRNVKRDAAARFAPRWRSDPTAFARDVFGFTPWEKRPGMNTDSQADVMRAITTSKRIAWRSGHKVGKSRAWAALALWAWVMFEKSRVILTAPTGRQIDRVVWREITELYWIAAKRGYHLGGRLFETWGMGLDGPNGRELFGVSTSDKDKFSGISGGHVFYFVDEGSGVEDAIWEAIFGNAAGGAWVITAGNPTRVEGQFYRCFHEESEVWSTFHTSSEETPNARMELAEFVPPEPLPGIAMREFIDERRRVWMPHEHHPLYAIRVKGDFPAQGATNVVSLAHVRQAIARYTQSSDTAWLDKPLVCGLDVARFGDDSNCLVMRRGSRVVGKVLAFAGMDSIQVAGHVRKAIREALTHREKSGLGVRPIVNVDVIGIGAGVFDQLAQFPELDVRAINVAEAATSNDDQYSNLRTQLWFSAADWIAKGGQMPDDARLRADLLAPTYAFDVRGRMKVEQKDDIKERLGRSPDHGDAFCLAVYSGGWTTTSGDVSVHVDGI